jgi:hypothetical protein
MKTITCWDVTQLKPELNTGCCSSCHSDEEEGYGSLCETYYGDVTIQVCCTMEGRLTEEIKQELIKLNPKED